VQQFFLHTIGRNIAFMGNFNLKDFDWNTYVATVAFLIPLLILAISWVLEYTGVKSNKRKREEAGASFNTIIENLSSDNTSSQLSAAVLLRRFFNKKIGKTYYLRKETMAHSQKPVFIQRLKTVCRGRTQHQLHLSTEL
jgi:predicted negative regulator of RcsB-dependent stress response